jgi:hypothetical protein
VPPLELPFEVPLEPDADEARDLLIRELSEPVYRAAEPTWFDRLSQAIGDWFDDLLQGGVPAPTQLGTVVIVLLVIGALVVLFLVFGLPRLGRRSRAQGALFGEHDERTSAQIRAAAETAAGEGDWSLATAEMFRALARALDERTLVAALPGTTAAGFARAAAEPFPDAAEQLRAAAVDFDAVRYLGEPGDRGGYERVRDLDARLRSTSPRIAAVPA